MFVTGRPFQPSLMFLSKALQNEAPFRYSTLFSAPGLFILDETSTLASSVRPSVTKKTSLKTFSPVDLTEVDDVRRAGRAFGLWRFEDNLWLDRPGDER